ncbi:Transcription elongation factor SPT5 [Halotydeus destructor]|nr:Transcription elongation factor SPT5 [Halotydeus destructor]
MSDSEDSGSGSEDEREEAPQKKVDDDGMEDFDDDEEDEDEEDYRSSKRRKRKKPKHGGFILDEAEVDDEVEDDEEPWEDGAEDYIDRTKRPVDNEARDIDSHRRLQMIFDKKEDEIEEYYRKKYAEASAAERSYYDNDGDLPDDVAQQALMPGVKDPNLWMVKCKIGEEKMTVLQLMRKFIAYKDSEEPLLIKSVVAPEGIKGLIYIEAYKQTHVKQAIEGLGNLRPGLWKQTMVPIHEMTDVLRVTKEQAHIKRGQWVRVKRGIYKDDLAQVDYVDTAQGMVHLKLIPRIDYTRKRGALRSKDEDQENLKRKRGKRPVAKQFDVGAIHAIGGDVPTDGDFSIFEGNRYRRGFLYKNFPMSAILVDGVKPSLSELDKFENQEGTEVAETMVAEGKSHQFATGDNVEVTEGELMNLPGKVIAVDGNKITMIPKHEDLKEPLEFQAHELKKYFNVGDHVKVMEGLYEGDTGLVVRVDEKHIVLFSDLTMHEIKVLPKDLQICTDMATGVDSLGQFQLGDLVQIDPQTVGVIVRLEKEYFQILNMNGKIVRLKHQAVNKKRDTKRAVSLDSEQNHLMVNDQVKVIDGPHSGRSGVVKHIFRSFAFIHSRIMMENGGVFVCKTRSLQLAGGSRPLQTNNSPNLGYMSPRMASPRHPSQGGAGGGGGGGGGGRGGGSGGGPRGGRDRSDLDMIGKTIKITRGTYKGHIGIVKDAIGKTARVELHSQCQTITVDKERIEVVGASGGQRTGGLSTYSRTPGYSGNQTPMVNSGSRTPMYGSQTPLYDGNRTPRHGGQTPSHDPSRTPMHGGSSVWDPSSGQTPRPDFDDYSDPSPGPNYLNPPTPGFGNPDTPQAGPYTPQTPGMYSADHTYSPYQPVQSPAFHGAPSPAGGYVPSPAGYGVGGPSSNYGYNPMTPGGVAPSPMGYNPQTPGAGMEHMHSVEWQTTDIEVRIRGSHDDHDLIGQTGIIRGISGGMCSVFLPTEDRVVNILSEHLEPVTPQKGDNVKVIFGENREQSGRLLSIDNQEGVVQLEGDEVTMVQLRYLCKMKV